MNIYHAVKRCEKKRHEQIVRYELPYIADLEEKMNLFIRRAEELKDGT